MRTSKKSKHSWKQMKMNTQQPKTIVKRGLRGKFIVIQDYLKKVRNISNKQPNLNTYKNWRNNNKQSPERVEGRK